MSFYVYGMTDHTHTFNQTFWQISLQHPPIWSPLQHPFFKVSGQSEAILPSPKHWHNMTVIAQPPQITIYKMVSLTPYHLQLTHLA